MSSHPLHGLNIVITGTLVVGTRADIETFIVDSGGVARTSVSGKTDLLVYGEKPGTKLAKAQSLGVATISEQEFYDRYIFTSDEPSLAGKSVVITGTLVIGTRADVDAFIAASGGLAKGSVSSKTDLLIVGEKPGSKLAKAQQLGVEIMTEAEFYARFGFES